jgi:phospholipase C
MNHFCLCSRYSDDPLHDFDNTHQQLDGTNMDGFVYNAIQNGNNETNPVSMFDSKTAPIINMLAKEYAVFDHWFCSIPGPTDPNRGFAMSGTSRGVLDNFNGTLWQQQSFFDLVRSHNRTFGAYYQDDLWAVAYFEDMNKPENEHFIHELEPTFFEHAASGKLPQFTWLQPRMTASPGKLPTWQHPDASVLEGERLIKQVYEAIRASPVWNKTLFLITYDEHGGFYDHISVRLMMILKLRQFLLTYLSFVLLQPPEQGIPNPDGIRAPNGFNFDRLGVRVPTIAISPWIQKNTIVSGPFPMEQPTATSQYDSTSILATAHHLLGLREAGAPMLGARTKWANTFVGLLHQRSQSEGPRTDCPKYLPALPEVEDMEAAVAIQRSKPLNEHLISELTFYCFEHYDGLDNCPGHPELKYNQGLASDWILDETDKFFERHGRITNRRREKLLQEMK